MGVVTTERNNNSIKLIFSENERSGCAIMMLATMSLFLFLIPLLTMLILKIELSVGAFIVIITAWASSLYLFKLYLWNKYGKEVIIIKRNTIEIYYEYKLFIDNKKMYEFNKIDMYFIEKDKIITDDVKCKVKHRDNRSVIIFKIDDKYVESHHKVPVDEIIKIVYAINSFKDEIKSR